jgi:hypothetical protein
MRETEEDRSADPAFEAVDEAGGGVSEGFEQAEQALIDRIADPDRPGEHPARHESVEEHQSGAQVPEDAEADHEHSSERPADDR